MVARPRRNADVGDVMLHCDRRDQRLRPVAPGHPDDVCTLRDGPIGELAEVVAAPEQQGFDLRLLASSARLKRSAFPPPELGLMISTPLFAGIRGAPMPAGICIRVLA